MENGKNSARLPMAYTATYRVVRIAFSEFFNRKNGANPTLSTEKTPPNATKMTSEKEEEKEKKKRKRKEKEKCRTLSPQLEDHLFTAVTLSQNSFMMHINN